MFSLIIFLLLSSVKAQYYNQPQQQYPYNNYNQWSSFPQNYPLWNQGIQQSKPIQSLFIQYNKLVLLDQAVVRGNLLNDDTSALPYGSQIIVSLTDVSLQDVASRPLNSLVLYGSYRFPIAFEIPYSMAQVQQNSNTIRQYAIQARIEKDGQLLYINDQYTPVQLIPAPMSPINVMMKKVGTPSIPGGLYIIHSL